MAFLRAHFRTTVPATFTLLLYGNINTQPQTRQRRSHRGHIVRERLGIDHQTRRLQVGGAVFKCSHTTTVD